MSRISPAERRSDAIQPRGVRTRVLSLALLLALAVVGTGQAQPATDFCETAPPAASGFWERVDVRGLAHLYCLDAPAAARLLEGAHVTSYPAFYGAVPAAWLGAWMLRDEHDFTDAYRLTLTQVTTFGATVGLKRLVGRPRPFVTRPIPPRTDRSPEVLGRFESFPSGHASLSVALATSWSLSHPQWYVVAPSAAWAGAVAVSRLYLGVHYPSDVIVGGLLGAGIATGVHLLRDALTPEALRPSASAEAPPPVTVRVRF